MISGEKENNLFERNSKICMILEVKETRSITEHIIVYYLFCFLRYFCRGMLTR